MKNNLLIISMAAAAPLLHAQTTSLADVFSQGYQQENVADYAGAIKLMKSAYDEKSYEINLRMGWLHYEAGLFTESQAYYQKAIELMPYSIEAKFGYIYPAAALGNWDKVMAQYQNILAIDPQNTTAGYKLGMVYYGRKDYAEAYKCFEKVVNLYPFGYDALLMFAWCNYQTGKMREAKVLFNKVLLVSPGDSSALEGLGLIK